MPSYEERKTLLRNRKNRLLSRSLSDTGRKSRVALLISFPLSLHRGQHLCGFMLPPIGLISRFLLFTDKLNAIFIRYKNTRLLFSWEWRTRLASIGRVFSARLAPAN